MKVKESEKTSLKLNIQKTNIMASGPITLWQVEGKAMETDKLFSCAPKSLWKVTAAVKLKEFNFFWKKSYDKPRQPIKKRRHHLVNKGPHCQSYGFSSSENWTINKAEHRKTDAFKL